MSTLVYYLPAVRTFRADPGPGAIAVPGLIFQELMDDQRAGKPMELSSDGSMPQVVANLLTLNGLRAAVAREVKLERATWTNALITAGYKVQRLLAALPPAPTPPTTDPQAATRAQYVAVLAGVDGALAFLSALLTDPAVLAVQPGTEAGQGAAALKEVIYAKWLAYAATAPSPIKAALADVI